MSAFWRCRFVDGPHGVSGTELVVPVAVVHGRQERRPSRYYEFIQKIEFGPLVCGDIERVMLHRYELVGSEGPLEDNAWSYRYLGCGFAVRAISCQASG